MKNIILALGAIACSLAAFAQTPGNPSDVKFKLVADPVPGTATGSYPTTQFYHSLYAGAAWGDPDDDGRMDLIYSDLNSHISNQTIQVNNYINEGDGTMRRYVRHGFKGTAFSCPVWFDFDNDGRLDLLLPGLGVYGHNWRNLETNLDEVVAHLYRNTGTNSGAATFEEVTGHGIVPLYNGLGGGKGHNWVATGDFDKDGYTDLLMAGFDESARILRPDYEEAVRALYLYRNIEGKRFERVEKPLDGESPFPGMTDGSVCLEDLDGDGWLDIFATGYGRSRTSEAHIYWNNGDGTFTEYNGRLKGLANGSCHTADLDNDGLPELVCGGVYMNTNTKYLLIYKNLGDRRFELIDENRLIGSDGTQLAFGDVNQDGLVDILVGGHFKTHEHTTLLYINQGDLNFTANGAHYSDTFGKLGHFSRITHGAHHLVDVNGDGYLDVWASGWTNGGCSNGCNTELYLNNSASKGIPANAAPGVPTNLAATADEAGMVTFTWDAPADDNTPASGLRYNLFLRSVADGSTFMVVPANTATGYVRVARIQNAVNRCTYTTAVTRPGEYEWGVQAIDAANAGGLFDTARATFSGAGVESAEIDDIRIWGAEGAVCYAVDAEAEITVYSLSGQTVGSQRAAGSGSIALAPGLYIVTASDDTQCISRKINVR